MKKLSILSIFLISNLTIYPIFAQNQKTINPIIRADVPDLSMIRVGDTYYMSSTTMHLSPFVPIMKLKELVNWEIVSFAYDILDTRNAMVLTIKILIDIEYLLILNLESDCRFQYEHQKNKTNL